MNKSAIITIAIIFFLAPTSLALDKTPNLSVIPNLSSQSNYSKVILRPQNSASTEANHILLKENTKKVIIVAGDYDLKKEAASFAQFRRRYIVYWYLALIMTYFFTI